MTMTAAEIAEDFGGEVIGDASFEVETGKPVHCAQAGELAFANDRSSLGEITDCQGVVVLVPKNLRDSLPASARCTFIVTDDPKSAFIQVMSRLHPPPDRESLGISDKAFISNSAEIGEDCNIHPWVHIGEDVVIGNHCDIHPGVCIGSGCRIGDNVVLYPYVVLYPSVKIGNRVSVHAATILGADGFGYTCVDGRHQRILHFGDVVIEDDVEIGVSTSIDRSISGSTRIGEGTKIDNHVVVAHNCELGKHNLLVAQVGLAGSVTTGQYVVCAGQVGVADHVHLGDGAVIGAQAGVANNLTGGHRYFGSPANLLSDAKKQLMALRRLPKLRHTVRQLESDVEQLRSQIEQLTQSGNSASNERETSTIKVAA